MQILSEIRLRSPNEIELGQIAEQAFGIRFSDGKERLMVFVATVDMDDQELAAALAIAVKLEEAAHALHMSLERQANRRWEVPHHD